MTGDFRITRVIRVGFAVIEFTIVMDVGQIVGEFWVHLQPKSDELSILPSDPEYWDFCELCLTTVQPYLHLLRAHHQALEGKSFPYSERAQEIADALLLFMR